METIEKKVTNITFAVMQDKESKKFSYYWIYYSFDNWETFEHTWTVWDSSTTYYLKDKEKENNVFRFETEKEAREFYEKKEKEHYCYDWKETTEEKYNDMLEVLPPERRTFIKWEWEIFRMSEYTTWNITTHYKQKWDKYFVWSFATDSYNDIKEIF